MKRQQPGASNDPCPGSCTSEIGLSSSYSSRRPAPASNAAPSATPACCAAASFVRPIAGRFRSRKTALRLGSVRLAAVSRIPAIDSASSACAGGAAAYLPTDGTNVPDYLVLGGCPDPRAERAVRPRLRRASLRASGAFRDRAGGHRSDWRRWPMPLPRSPRRRLLGIVMVAESAGLMGAALRRSPAIAPPASAAHASTTHASATHASATLFTHPQIREWLSFTPSAPIRAAWRSSSASWRRCRAPEWRRCCGRSARAGPGRPLPRRRLLVPSLAKGGDRAATDGDGDLRRRDACKGCCTC